MIVPATPSSGIRKGEVDEEGVAEEDEGVEDVVIALDGDKVVAMVSLFAQ